MQGRLPPPVAPAKARALGTLVFGGGAGCGILEPGHDHPDGKTAARASHVRLRRGVRSDHRRELLHDSFAEARLSRA